MTQPRSRKPPFDPEDIISWAQSPYGFYLPDASFARGRPHPGPVRFGPHQARILRHVFTKDEHGRFPYDTVVYSCPKKSGKTTIGAVVTEWFGTTQESPNEIFVVANDRDQAQSRGYRKVRYSVEAKKRRGSVRAEVGVRKIVYSTGSEILALSSDYGSEAGGNHGLATFDELWAYTSEAARRLWDELTPVPTRVNSVRFITTYAGFEGESELLWSLYEAGVGPEEFKEGRGERIPELSDLPCWRNGRLFVYWDHELRPHPGLTISPAEYHAAQKATSLRASAYIRLHENRWTSGAESFIDLQKWDDCVDPAMRPRMTDRKTLYWVHVDVAPKHDSSAVVGVRYNLKLGRVELGFHRIWQPSARDPLDLEQTIEAYLMDIKTKFRLLGISWDPYQFHRSAMTLENRGLPMVEFPQTVPNLTAASQQLYDLIYNRNLMMYPSDELRLQASRAVAVEKTRGWKIAKEKTTHKIDAVVALAAACYFIVTEGSYDVSEPITVSAQFSDDLAVDGVRVLREQEALLPPEFRSVA